jgi:hypothetical protein
VKIAKEGICGHAHRDSGRHASLRSKRSAERGLRAVANPNEVKIAKEGIRGHAHPDSGRHASLSKFQATHVFVRVALCK